GVKVYISSQVDKTKLAIKNPPKGAKIIKLVNAQEYINKKCPAQEDRKKLEEIGCLYNLLTDINLPDNSTNLKKLVLSNNNFPAQNLSFLTKAINLEILKLGN
ncbi:19845_t:CDS:2, partial [Gigaspora margarita]